MSPHDGAPKYAPVAAPFAAPAAALGRAHGRHRGVGAVGVVSVLSLRGYVTAVDEAEVAESMHAFSHAYARYRNGEHTSIHTGTPPISQALLEFTGQTPGNLIAVIRDGKVIASAVFSEDEPRPAPPDVIKPSSR